MGRRVLVTYVGDNDPYGRPDPKTGEPTTGPILSILDHLQAQGKLPDQVILLVTKSHDHEFPLLGGGTALYKQEGKEAQAGKVKTAITERYSPAITVIEIFLQVNPADLDEVVEHTLKGLRGCLNPEDEVHINVSSGTPAMSAAITFLVDSGYVQHYQVWQSLNPTKLPERAIRVKQVNLAYLSERNRLDHALKLLEMMSFSQAEEAFKEVARRTLIPERRPKAEAVAQLMKAYHLWDSAEFDKALDEFRKAKLELQKLNGWARIPHLEDQEQALEKVKKDCESKRETQHTLQDLYAGLLRRQRSRDFLLSIPSRGRRLYEGILDFLIREAGIDLQSPPKKEIDGLNLPRQTKERILRGAAELRDRQEVADALAGKGCLDRILIERLEDLYEKFRKVRNDSREEHGFGGVSELQANCVIESVKEMMAGVFPKSAKGLENHPFGVKALDEVAQDLREWL